MLDDSATYWIFGRDRHKTRSVFERYNIVSEGDLTEVARKLNASSKKLAAKVSGKVGAFSADSTLPAVRK
jgi:hypothetical protein